MPELHIVAAETTKGLATEALGGLGCEDLGIVVLRGSRTWGAHETGAIEVPRPGRDVLRVAIAYDEREAPYAVAARAEDAAGVAPSTASARWAPARSGFASTATTSGLTPTTGRTSTTSTSSSSATSRTSATAGR